MSDSPKSKTVLNDLPNNPVNHQQRPSTCRNLLVPIYASPGIHRRKAAHERDLPKVKHRRVPDIR